MASYMDAPVITISGDAALDAFCAGNGTDGSALNPHVIQNENRTLHVVGTTRYLIISNWRSLTQTRANIMLVNSSNIIIYSPMAEMSQIVIDGCVSTSIINATLYTWGDSISINNSMLVFVARSRSWQGTYTITRSTAVLVDSCHLRELRMISNQGSFINNTSFNSLVAYNESYSLISASSGMLDFSSSHHLNLTRLYPPSSITFHNVTSSSISDSTLDRPDQNYGFYFYNSHGNNITSCTIKGFEAAGIVLKSSNNNKFTGCTVSDCGASYLLSRMVFFIPSLTMDGGYPVIDEGTGNVFTGCTITDMNSFYVILVWSLVAIAIFSLILMKERKKLARRARNRANISLLQGEQIGASVDATYKGFGRPDRGTLYLTSHRVVFVLQENALEVIVSFDEMQGVKTTPDGKGIVIDKADGDSESFEVSDAMAWGDKIRAAAGR
ncbi:MAG: right-handed parallel beta-helix repeat-containing protein [Candidatus Lokiarchaeota archaeon]|nr:right-handed parallel beta-helix repeat-containing protein [Candidatus Lokiarchaeota archaeon]